MPAPSFNANEGSTMTQRYKLMIPTTAPVLNDDGSVNPYRSKEGPPVEMEFELTIDIDRIKGRLGRVAAHAKTGRSQEMSGLVVVKRINPK